MKAQFVSEKVNFERGIDPRKSLGVGMWMEIEMEQMMERLEKRFGGSHIIKRQDSVIGGTYYNDMFSSKGRIILYDVNSKSFKFTFPGMGRVMPIKDLDYFEEDVHSDLLRREQEIKELGYNPYLKELGYNPYLNLAENVKFERGRDPKTAMGVGIFGNMPQEGQMQKDSFDLMGITKTICKVYNLSIKNYTPIDEKSNYVWDKGYQNQFLTMNLHSDRYTVAEFLGDEYWDRIEALMGEDYTPRIQLGISSHQMHWISKNDGQFEFDGNYVFCQVRGSGWRIPVDFRKSSNVENWLTDRIKDDIMQQAIWDLRYSEPLSKKKIPSGYQHARDIEEVEIDVSIYCDEYSQEELENLMSKSYMWTKSVRSWKIEDGILSFRD